MSERAMVSRVATNKLDYVPMDVANGYRIGGERFLGNNYYGALWGNVFMAQVIAMLQETAHCLLGQQQQQ